MKNTSGIHPCLDRVLIKPDEVERTSPGGIIIPEATAEKHSMAQSIGTFIEAGPDAYLDYTEIHQRSDGRTAVVTRGYKGPAAKPGDRVAFAKYAGLQVEGQDGQVYRMLNDEDITAVVEEGVSFNDLKGRKPMYERK